MSIPLSTLTPVSTASFISSINESLQLPDGVTEILRREGLTQVPPPDGALGYHSPLITNLRRYTGVYADGSRLFETQLAIGSGCLHGNHIGYGNYTGLQNYRQQFLASTNSVDIFREGNADHFYVITKTGARASTAFVTKFHLSGEPSNRPDNHISRDEFIMRNASHGLVMKLLTPMLGNMGFIVRDDGIHYVYKAKAFGKDIEKELNVSKTGCIMQAINHGSSITLDSFAVSTSEDALFLHVLGKPIANQVSLGVNPRFTEYIGDPAYLEEPLFRMLLVRLHSNAGSLRDHMGYSSKETFFSSLDKSLIRNYGIEGGIQSTSMTLQTSAVRSRAEEILLQSLEEIGATEEECSIALDYLRNAKADFHSIVSARGARLQNISQSYLDKVRSFATAE
ncbi:MAG TPA: hypothetical protein VFM18_05295 [Methanosarcina sp.]|nr:hypothetical protein [Methanosarcina sp.]